MFGFFGGWWGSNYFDDADRLRFLTSTSFQLVPLPGPFRRELTQLLLLDTVAVLAIEKACLRFFPAG